MSEIEWPREAFGDHLTDKASAALRKVVDARREVYGLDDDARHAVVAEAGANALRVIYEINAEIDEALAEQKDSGRPYPSPVLWRFHREVMPILAETQRELEALGFDEFKASVLRDIEHLPVDDES